MGNYSPDTDAKSNVLRGVQVLFGSGCVVIAVPLIFRLGPAETVTNATSVRILGGALMALAFGAFSAAKDPRRYLVILRVEIVFTALTAAFLTYRLLTDDIAQDRTWLVLPPVAACMLLLLLLYPRARSKQRSTRD